MFHIQQWHELRTALLVPSSWLAWAKTWKRFIRPDPQLIYSHNKKQFSKHHCNLSKSSKNKRTLSLFSQIYEFDMIERERKKETIKWNSSWAANAVSTWPLQFRTKTSNVERGLLQMQHLLVCLQGTVGDHTGGINKDCKPFQRESFLLPLSLPVHYRIEIFFCSK